MIKSTAFVLGFLFAISTAYLLSFWGFFDIDVLQYFAVTDIIKGIAYPLRYAGVGLLGMASLVWIVGIFSFVVGSQHVDKNTKRSIWTFLGISVALLGALFFSETNSLLGVALAVVASILLLMTYDAIDDGYKGVNAARVANSQPPLQHPAVRILDLVTAYGFPFLLTNAIIAGQIDARRIHAGTEYNYIITSDLPKEKAAVAKGPYFIFLGAASEKYIFIDHKEEERLVIDKEELKVMSLHHYNAADTASVRRKELYLMKKPATVGKDTTNVIHHAPTVAGAKKDSVAKPKAAAPVMPRKRSTRTGAKTGRGSTVRD